MKFTPILLQFFFNPKATFLHFKNLLNVKVKLVMRAPGGRLESVNHTVFVRFCQLHSNFCEQAVF